MKITHCIASIDKNAGGPSTYMKDLIEGLNGSITQNLISFDSPNNINIDAEINILLSNAKKHLFSSEAINFNLKAVETDLFHGNGLWQIVVHAMADRAQKRNIPYIISTHGMLEPWSLKQSKFKKKIALKLFQYNDLEKANCLHATAKQEARGIREFGLRNPIAVIPNGINTIEYFCKTKNPPKKILFLSRIVKNKGLTELIEACSEIPTNLIKDWQIEIVGNGDCEYIHYLNNLIIEKGLVKNITIKPALYNSDKIAAYQEASIFVLPTYSENFGIVIAEALACGTPVITTKGTPWEDLELYNCGWWINNTVDILKDTLTRAMNMNEAQLQEMGLNGRKLIEEKYSIESVAKKFILLYEWVLKGGEKPDFVYL